MLIVRPGAVNISILAFFYSAKRNNSFVLENKHICLILVVRYCIAVCRYCLGLMGILLTVTSGLNVQAPRFSFLEHCIINDSLISQHKTRLLI